MIAPGDCKPQLDSGPNGSAVDDASSQSVENAAYSEMLRRMIRAYGRRVGAGDPEDLTVMLDVAVSFDDAITHAVHALRAQGYSWADVARVAGITRQAAFQKWGRS